MSLHSTAFRLSKPFRACTRIMKPSRLLVRYKATLEQAVGLPPRPKRPLTPYFRFLKQIRPSLVEQNPKASVIEITKLVAEHWNKVDSTAKEKLESEFKQDQEKYAIQKLQYDSELTEEDRKKLTMARHERVLDKERRELRKKRKEFNKPKKNPSAFVLWMQTEMENRGDKPFRAFLLHCADKWRSLSDKEKQPYLERSNNLLEKYKKEMEVWETKMIRLGNTDLIRTESQLEPRKKKVPTTLPRKQKVLE